MQAELVPVKFNKIMQTHAYTVVVLGTEAKLFAIYTEPNIGKVLQQHLTGVKKARPLTHDLLSLILEGLNVRIKQIVIHDLQETIYFARLFLEQEIESRTHIVEIDARPSDCIILALTYNVPVYCTKEVLEKALPVED
jgi:hypothetical protein